MNKDNNKIRQKYKILQRLGKGSFGSVYHAIDRTDKTEVAIKVEEKSSRSQLAKEYAIYKALIDQRVCGIPSVSCYFESKRSCFMVMQLLGESLDQKFNNDNAAFEIRTVLKLGIHITRLLESIHNAGFLHRDIKPNNFLVGLEEDANLIFIMDFGLSKRYIDADGEHTPFREGRSLVGTARYASTNVHLGFEPSRRDDLESVGYMLVYFLQKRLPWQGLKKDETTDQVKLIGEVKMKTTVEQLCHGLPKVIHCCFDSYFGYVKTLKFEQTPNYNYLVSLFVAVAQYLHTEPKFYWS